MTWAKPPPGPLQETFPIRESYGQVFLYHDGSEGMGWHSDDEPSLVSDAFWARMS